LTSSRGRASSMNVSIRRPVFSPTTAGWKSSQWVISSPQSRRSVASPTPRTGMKEFSIPIFGRWFDIGE